MPRMKYTALALLLASDIASTAGIDLDCETLSVQMVNRLAAEGLLTQAAQDRQRALEVTRKLCGSAEVSAQQQHEKEKQQALDNWFFEKRPEKKGNKRLKNLKR